MSYSHSASPATWFEHVFVPGMAWVACAVTVPPDTVPSATFSTVSAVQDWVATQDAAPTLAWASTSGTETEAAFRQRVLREIAAAGMSGVTATIFAPPNYWHLQNAAGTGNISAGGTLS